MPIGTWHVVTNPKILLAICLVFFLRNSSNFSSNAVSRNKISITHFVTIGVK